ncbi:hypothetical protein A7982_13541 [Minicystis rosea]|nr:hypothetical protein A7982_13541 [Minicystis rosea]
MMAELAAAGDARAEVLARRGLDEARWDVVDAYWQGRLSEALEQEDDGLAEIVSAYTAAYEAAQRALAPPISIEQLATATRLFQANGDLRASLAKVGISLADYVRGTEHWSRQLATDPDVERRFDEALRGR